MSLVVLIMIGMAIGAMVELLLPGHHPAELLLAMLLGVAGAVLAHFVGLLTGWYEVEDAQGFIAGALGAVLMLLIYGGLFGRLKSRPK